MKNVPWLKVDAMRRHPRMEESRMWRVRIGDDGKLRSDCLFAVIVTYPRDGMGRLAVGIADYTIPYPSEDGYWYGTASGCGYNKVTGATIGGKIMGVELGDDCDYKGRPTLKAFVDSLRFGEHDNGATCYVWSGSLSL